MQAIYKPFSLKKKENKEDVKIEPVEEQRRFTNPFYKPKEVQPIEKPRTIQSTTQTVQAQEQKSRSKQNKDSNKPYKPSDRLLNYIISKEGFLRTPKNIGDGVMTVGHGLTDPEIVAKHRYGITESESKKYVKDTLDYLAGKLSRSVPNWDIMNQNQRDALISYAYNYKGENMIANSPALTRYLRNKDWNNAANEINAGWNNYKFPGLRKRRQEEQAWFLEGLDEDLP